MSVKEIKALLFDVFGTVVDWRRSVIREGEALAWEKGLQVDWPRFADTWRRDGYLDAIKRIRLGGEPWADVDTLHRRQLDKLVEAHGVEGLSEAELAHFSRVWHRLTPWPDAVPALLRLKSRFIIAPLSNGTFALLTNMAKYSGLPWDCIFSSDLFHHYKQDLEVYRGAIALLGLEPSEAMLVAAHSNDLEAARTAGLRTAFVSRPLEWGADGPAERVPEQPFDFRAADFADLAAQLGV